MEKEEESVKNNFMRIFKPYMKKISNQSLDLGKI
jgi:hypothetical protein